MRVRGRGGGAARAPAARRAAGLGSRRDGLVSRYRSRCLADRGSATVWTLAVIAVLCVVFGAVLALGQAVLARHRAAGGADLAALAVADHWTDGSEAACARADRLARAQGARLVRCVVVGEVSDVTAAAGRGPFTVEVRARAGPAAPVAPVPPVVSDTPSVVPETGG
ncbi:Rv3654c family TadE-like protein [Streptomyces galilaeus]|uniref:Rv3654c family TadE-like protein n=1 Tax=Streptomyces galilaeus TaxID=33899 RepID=UPI0038F6210E